MFDKIYMVKEYSKYNGTFLNAEITTSYPAASKMKEEKEDYKTEITISPINLLELHNQEAKLLGLEGTHK